MYETSSSIMLLGEDSETINSYTAQMASQNLLVTYQQLIESDEILQGVVEDLSLPFDYVALDEMITPNAVEDTILININVSDSDPARAAKIADTTAQRFVAFIDENQSTTLSSPVKFESVARVPTEPYEPNPTTAALLGAFVGLLLGIALVAVLEFLDNTIKPGQDIQATTNAPCSQPFPN